MRWCAADKFRWQWRNAKLPQTGVNPTSAMLGQSPPVEDHIGTEADPLGLPFSAVCRCPTRTGVHRPHDLLRDAQHPC